MAGSKSNYLEALALDVFIGAQSYTPPANLYLALYTTGTLTDASTGSVPLAVEVSGGSYARLAITNNATEWPAASGNPTRKTNANLLTFVSATADWGSLTQWALLDALTAGNIYYFGTFDVAKTILSGDTSTIPAQALQLFED